MALRAPSSIPGTNRSGWRSLSWNGHTGAWWEGTRQWHELKCKRISLEIGKSLFPRGQPSSEEETGETGLSLTVGVSCPDWLKPWAAGSEPMVEPALGSGCDRRLPQAPPAWRGSCDSVICLNIEETMELIGLANCCSFYYKYTIFSHNEVNIIPVYESSCGGLNGGQAVANIHTTFTENSLAHWLDHSVHWQQV